MSYDSHYQLRSELRAAVRSDLLGPQGGSHEVLTTDAPITAYLTGILFPLAADARRIQDAKELDGQTAPDLVRGDDAEQGINEFDVSPANTRKPSSIGLTFAVASEITSTIQVMVEAAMYAPEDENGLPIEPTRSEARSTDQQRERWRRKPFECEPVTLDISVRGIHPKVALQPGLDLRVRVRHPNDAGVVIVTVTVVNVLTTGEFDLQDASCFFQPTIVVTGPPGTEPFVESEPIRDGIDDEQTLSRLLYRHAPSFAVGHGCAASWDWQPPEVRTPIVDRATVPSIRSEFMPTHEVLLTDSNAEIDDAALGMLLLGERERDDVVRALSGLLDGYREWIGDRRADAGALAGSEYERVAGEQIRLAEDALDRMYRGLALLHDGTRPEVFRAFQLANRAMAQQRARTRWIKSGREGVLDVDSGRWRPFQIAFLLLCLEGIVDEHHPDREVADLLWFPTGGGKTEAYLGLIAFAVFLRRLRDGDCGDGVTVIMRYTLRLLTLQQFERAASLICAMERLRTEQSDLGAEPISIGMWVGRSATPNSLEMADKQLEKLRKNPPSTLKKENPYQLRTCPWCGEQLTPHDYTVQADRHRMTVNCPNSDCEFHDADGLPVHLIDEAIYHAHPTLIISTVDKFAAIPWRPATAALFNRDLAGRRPPELIVQDELHLISGPLGTLTGLYETAIDILAARPKVIASTATIRRASDQVTRLFDRRIAQFPPTGLDSRDSWFAAESSRDKKATRRYLGLFTPSGSQTTLLVRTYAALIHSAHTLASSADPAALDAYWTLVGYFNSLRLLSAAELQVLDDVHGRLALLAKRDGCDEPRSATRLIELSSRSDASQIPSHLKFLDQALPDSPEVCDVVLATNMISVGVDIDRLGLMAVMGQPQTTAEYIQATSRVGRRHPGLVAIMLNSARPRDRSHYEAFQSFHSALYREVESTSVTPFSARARDRGLHAVLVGLTRLMIPGATANEDAGRIEDFIEQIDSLVIPRILERVGRVNPEEQAATADFCAEFVEWWRAEAQDHAHLVYEAKRGTKQRALLSGFDTDSDDDLAGWATLWSLRDVDAQSTLFFER
ncbi:helicase-related protein [Nocardia sp. NPDC055321]